MMLRRLKHWRRRIGNRKWLRRNVRREVPQQVLRQRRLPHNRDRQAGNALGREGCLRASPVIDILLITHKVGGAKYSRVGLPCICLRIPTGFRITAQGCAHRATLGKGLIE